MQVTNDKQITGITAGSRSAPKSVVATLITPDQWAAQLSGPADYTSCPKRWPTALLRHWINTSPQMDQPALNHSYIVQHLGGPKRVDRTHDGASVSTLVEEGAITIVPVGTRFQWKTQGPIEFAHLYLSPTVLQQASSRFNRSSVALIDRVGSRDPLLKALFACMLAEVRKASLSEPLYLDTLLEAFLLHLVRNHATTLLATPSGRELLPMFRLRRVYDYVEARIAERLDLADLARVAGGSVFHFSRAFKNSSGASPYQYVLRRRTEHAMKMLIETECTQEHIARACGFTNVELFAKTFRRFVGTTPLRYRNSVSHRTMQQQ